jgi:Outer membrane protein beta-barrel domain
MKKSLILLIFFCSILYTAFAQKNKSTNKQANMEYGFLSGVNFNSVRKNNQNIFLKENLTNYTGLSIGGYFKININQLFGIKVLAQYDQNGYRLGDITFTDASGNNLAPGNVTIKTTYLNFPIVAEFTFGNKIKYYVNAGPYVGFLLSSSVISKISSTASSQASTTKTKSDGYKSTNFGVSFGTGTLIPISKKLQLHVAIKNNVGLSNIIKPISSDNSPLKTNAFSILAGINIGL